MENNKWVKKYCSKGSIVNGPNLIKDLEQWPEESFRAAREIVKHAPKNVIELFLRQENRQIREALYLATIVENRRNSTKFNEQVLEIKKLSSKSNNFIAEFLATFGAIIRFLETGDDTEGLFDWLSDALVTVIGTAEDVAKWVVETVENIVDLVVDAGEGLVSILSGLANWTKEAIADLLTALFKAGLTLADLIKDVITYTYDLSSKFVQALIALGKTIKEILGEVAGETYWALRRIVNGIIDALGPVGDILEWAYEQSQDLVEQVMKAIRYAGGVITDAIEWAYLKGVDALEDVVRAWEEMGETLLELYTWIKEFALKVGEFVWFLLGQVTQKIKNSIYYVLNFLKNDVIPAIALFTKGLVHAGLEIVKLVTWIVGETIQIAGHILLGILNAGIALTDLLVAIMQNGSLDQALEAFVDEIGKTFNDLFGAIKDSGEEFIEQLVLTYHGLKDAVIEEILEAVWDLAKGSFGFVVTMLLNTLSTYRGLNNDEITEARKIFGDALDYDKIYISEEEFNPMNDIIFWVQNKATGGGSDPRAFVTGSYINFSPSHPLTYLTLIHELTHVLQSIIDGFKYMAEALIGNSAGYDYGYNSNSYYQMWDAMTSTWITLNGGYLFGQDGRSNVPEATEEGIATLHREAQAQLVQHIYAILFLSEDGYIREVPTHPSQPDILVTFTDEHKEIYQAHLEYIQSS